MNNRLFTQSLTLYVHSRLFVGLLPRGRDVMKISNPPVLILLDFYCFQYSEARRWKQGYMAPLLQGGRALSCHVGLFTHRFVNFQYSTALSTVSLFYYSFMLYNLSTLRCTYLTSSLSLVRGVATSKLCMTNQR